jgi:O-antigen/teichoic acid export membrane protein
VLAILLPGLLLQDAWRFSFVATGRPTRAVVNDATWLMSQLIAFSAVALLTVPTAPVLLGAWCLAGGVAGLLGIAQSGVVPSLSRAVAFAREHRDLNWHLAGEQLVSQGANQLGILILAGLLPLGSIGALRSGQLILSPLNVMQQAAPLVGLPEARRGTERSSGALVRTVTVLAVVLAAAPVLLALGIGMVPASVGTWALGDGWEAGLSVLAALTVRNVAGGVALACFVGLHALERTTQTMAIGAVRGGASLVLAVTAAAVAGLHAAVWAMAIADIAGAVVAVLVLRGAVHPTAPTDPIRPSREVRR